MMYPVIVRHEENTHFHFDNLFVDPPSFESIVLHQIGDIGCEKDYIMGGHVQYCYEISYVVSGKGVYFIDEHPYPVTKGDLIVCRPGEKHDGRADKLEPFRVCYTGFNFHKYPSGDFPFQRVQDCLDRMGNPVVADRLGVELHYQNILGELLSPNADSHFVIRLNLFQLLMAVYRNVSGYDVPFYNPYEPLQEKRKAVYGVVNYIDKHLYELKELKQIASTLGYSYTYLSHIFPQEMGVTIQDYYRKKRFEQAVEWLENSNLSITQIAEKLQYQSVHSFSQAFRKAFGVSPSAYQRNHKKDKS